MESYLEMIKSSPKGGEAKMWEMVENLSEHLEGVKEAHPEIFEKIMLDQYAILNGGHFNKEFALKKVSGMHHKDKQGTEHKGEVYSMEQTNALFESEKSKLPSDVNACDYYVLANMLANDNMCLLKSWFSSETEEQILERINELALNWYADEDRPFETIWSYLC